MTGWQTVRSGLSMMLLASAAACMAPQPRLASTPASMVPLEASIFPPYYGQVPFRVNKPAHVALFEILPGGGVSLLYPTSGSGFTQVRENWVPLQYSAQRWLYASNRFDDPGAGQWSGFDYGYGMGYGSVGSRSVARTSAPRYLFLIASEEPIEISQFQHNLGALRQFLGYNTYTSYQPYNVMETLAYAVVPYAADERWVTDVFVDWGYDWGYGYTPGTSAATASWVSMRCADGSTGLARFVPGWGYDMMTCAPWVNGQQNQAPGDSVTTPPIGSPDGRNRANGAAGEGRGRVGSDSSARPALHAPQSAETRTRISQLREDAARSQFNDLVNQQVRQNVELRHRADAVLGRGPGGSSDVRANSSNSGRPGSDGRATRSRGSSGSGEPSAGRGTGTSAPRSRESNPQPRTSTQSPPPSSSTPRSRESSPPASSTPAPAPAPRSRPPA